MHPNLLLFSTYDIYYIYSIYYIDVNWDGYLIQEDILSFSVFDHRQMCLTASRNVGPSSVLADITVSVRW